MNLPQLLSLLATQEGSHASILELVLGNIADGVGITDASGESLYFNAAARQILGLTADEPVDIRTHGASLYYLNDFDSMPEDELPLVRALRGEETKDVELFVRSVALAEGAVIKLDARPIRGKDGRIVGGVAVFHDVGARKRAEEELTTANAKLAGWVAELERRANVTTLMNEMAELLQSCRTMKEFYTVISKFASSIFEQEPGAIYVVNSSRSAIEMVAEWGDGPKGERVFAPTDCWALRRGRTHRSGGDALGPACDHARGGEGHAYTCIPMMGQGEALGVLHVRRPPQASSMGDALRATMAESQLRTVISVAEHVGLALANLKLRETLQSQAIRDPLTTLFNRRYMEESFEREIARAERSRGSVAAIMIDIDHFKRFNDTFGHAAADLALRETATLIRSMLRADDIACRFGGEELVLILPDTNVFLAAEHAEAIRAAIAKQALRYHGTPIGTVTASFGVAAYPEHGVATDTLLRAADEALYQAKREGRNRVCTKAVVTTSVQRLSIIPPMANVPKGAVIVG